LLISLYLCNGNQTNHPIGFADVKNDIAFRKILGGATIRKHHLFNFFLYPKQHFHIIKSLIHKTNLEKKIPKKMKHLLLLLFIFVALPSAYANKIYGKITDDQNTPLSFVTVYVEKINDKSFSKGTVSNTDGEFALALPTGKYSVSFRFVGYKTYTQIVDITATAVLLNIQLKAESISLQEVEISAKREDPAYEIIRNAQEKRKSYLKEATTYTANAYIKGLQRVDKAPRKVMGRDITIPGSEGDSVNRGIVYLSESVSEIYINKPDRKEIVVSSKVSGRNNAFSWNSALDLEINLYENSINLSELANRPMISPIANTAMLHYRYEYLGTVSEVVKGQNLLLHKIKLIPKQKGTPTFAGVIYIQDQNWRIYSTELLITKKETGINFVDSLTFRQVYIPIDQEAWKIGTQVANFRWSVAFFGLDFRGSGVYTGVFSDYKLNPAFDKKLFSSEETKVLEESNKKDSAYWAKVRPLALTAEETRDYVRKDSIFAVRDTKAYKDSVDKQANKFKLLNILTGYSYRNSYKNYRLSFEPPINNFQTNTVEGFVLNFGVNFYKANRTKYTIFSWANDIRYGLASNRLYWQTNLYRRFNGTNRFFLRLQGGTYIAQYNSEEPLSYLTNTIYTTFFKTNYLKIYEKNYVKISTGAEILNGVTLNVSGEFANRNALQNTDKGGYYFDWDKNKQFTSNNPQNEANDSKAFASHNALLLDAELTFKFKQTYISRPYLKVNNESNLPVLKISYRKGLADIDFDLLKASLQDEMQLGQLGRGEWILSGGVFINKSRMQFMDFAHFNTSQTIFSLNRLNSFFLLPYYQFSTNHRFVEAHYEQHFNGFLTNRIGVLRKLKWFLVAGGHYLHNEQVQNYGEVTVGIENIFSVGRVDFVAAFAERKELQQIGWRLRLSIGGN
jgi:hypothetical protein